MNIDGVNGLACLTKVGSVTLGAAARVAVALHIHIERTSRTSCSAGSARQLKFAGVGNSPQVDRDPSKSTRIAPLPHMFVVRRLIFPLLAAARPCQLQKPVALGAWRLVPS